MLEIELNKLKEKVAIIGYNRVKRRYEKELVELGEKTVIFHQNNNKKLFGDMFDDKFPKVLEDITWSLNIKDSQIILKVHTSKRSYRYQRLEKVLKDMAYKFDRVWFKYGKMEFINVRPYYNTGTIELRSKNPKDVVAFIVKYGLVIKKNYCVAKLEKHIDMTGRYWLTSRSALDDLKDGFEENGLKW